MTDISAFLLNIQLLGTDNNTKCQYIRQIDSNRKSEGTLFSSTFKIEESKVPSDFRLEVSWQRYRHFHYFLFHGVGLFYIILRPGAPLRPGINKIIRLKSICWWSCSTEVHLKFFRSAHSLQPRHLEHLARK